MRILTQKIYRAYPVLDKYEDEVCIRYIKRAKRLQNAWKFWLMVLFALPVSIAVWVGLMYITGILLNAVGYRVSNGIETGIILFSGTGIAWIPALTALLIRDFWLHRCVKKQLVGVQCPVCGYSLLGLTILEDQTHDSVHCPECGHRVVLKDMGLARRDIDPTLATEPA